jgi:hypothetical protein
MLEGRIEPGETLFITAVSAGDPEPVSARRFPAVKVSADGSVSITDAQGNAQTITGWR